MKRVSSDSHFTIILIGGLKKEHIAHLKKQHAAEFRKGLAHIYYFYLHGIHGHSTAAEMEDKHGLLSLKVLFYQQGKERKPFDLKQETTDTESQYQLRAKAQYDFTVDLRIVEKSGDRVYPVKVLCVCFGMCVCVCVCVCVRVCVCMCCNLCGVPSVCCCIFN